MAKRVHIATAVVCALFLVASTLDREGRAGVLEQQQHGPWQPHLRGLPSQLSAVPPGLWRNVYFGHEDGYGPSQNMPKALREVGDRWQASRLVGARQQSLKDFGVPWASPVAQGYPGEEVMGGPFVPTDFTSDVLETEDQNKLSTEGRWPYVKYYGQPTSFMHGNSLDPFFYDYTDDVGSSEYDSLPISYDNFLNEFDT